jgi:hypothetical protein
MLQTADVVFDDQRLVANAGVGLVSLLMRQMGVPQAAERLVSKGFRPGRKVCTVVAGMALGADSIDDLRVLRCGATERVLDHQAMAPETIGQWLRSLTWGHVAQLDKLLEHAIAGAWARGAGPSDDAVTIDMDASVHEVYGTKKQGASLAYNHTLGYHPLYATRADTGEMLKVWLREGAANSSRAADKFVRQVVKRARRCGAEGPITMRGDTAFYIEDVVKACRSLEDVTFSLGARQTTLVAETIAAIPEKAWQSIEYSRGYAQVAESYLPAPWSCRLIVRRFRNPIMHDPQERLFDEWQHAAFITDQVGDAVTLDAVHRQRAVQELGIKDLKDGPLAHMPSGSFAANAAWCVLALMAHNTVRWIAHLGLGHQGLVVARTMRFRLLSVPGRITRSARRVTLHMPAAWPWQQQWLREVRRIRGLVIAPK